MSENLFDPGDQNVERLLSEVYQPEVIPDDVTERTLARLERLASERRQRKPPEPSPWRRVAWLYFANAVGVVLLIVMPSLFWYYFMQSPDKHGRSGKDKRRHRALCHGGDERSGCE